MPGEIELRLYRDSLSTPWGFRLYGGKDLSTPLSVQRVSPIPYSDNIRLYSEESYGFICNLEIIIFCSIWPQRKTSTED